MGSEAREICRPVGARALVAYQPGGPPAEQVAPNLQTRL